MSRLDSQRIAAAVVAVFFVACTSVQFVEVNDIDTLYFGTNYPGGVVTDADWRAFVEEVITPRFPGFTEFNATGHWKSEREATHVVLITHLHRLENDQRIRDIIDAYKTRFHQEAVFLVREQGLAEAR